MESDSEAAARFIELNVAVVAVIVASGAIVQSAQTYIQSVRCTNVWFGLVFVDVLSL